MKTITSSAVSSSETILVIGNGPVGIHLVNQLLSRKCLAKIIIFGDEDCPPYNRVQLSAFLSRDLSYQQIQNPIRETENNVIQICSRIIKIDPENQKIQDLQGNWYLYDKLIIATGSRPHIPSIEGRELQRVYSFRNMKDVQSLLARLFHTRETVIVGGGLLGLETAKAMSSFSTKVTVIQHTPTLMNRQLDEEASLRIQHFAEKNNIEFKLNLSVRKICGVNTVEHLILSDGSKLICDTLIFSTGIVPNKELAQDAQINVRKGIQINSYLESSHNNIYAIGECADYENQVFGLVAPGLEQASILAANLTGDHRAYKGTTLISELKVLGLKVFSMGKVTEEFSNQIDDSWTYQTETNYRRIFLEKGRIIGVIAIGPWEEVKLIQNAITEGRRLWFWHQIPFQKNGTLFGNVKSDLNSLPASTMICNCQQVSLGEIAQCVSSKKYSFGALQEKLGVATVCGSCKPLVQQLLSEPVEQIPVNNLLIVKASLALMLSLSLIMLPPIPVRETVQIAGLDWLWTDKFAKQVTGFSILGLTAISLLLSFRKRIKAVKWLDFSLWRGTHIVLTVSALVVLFLHTGISLGEGINRWLILNFLLIAVIGGVSAAIAAIEGAWVSPSIKSAKRTLTYCHIVSFWPLPVLLAFHILSVYYF